jgi:hypothetical protein
MEAPPPAAPAPHADGRLFDPQFREGRPTELLLEGDPPLLRGTLDALIDAVETAEDVALTLAEEQAIRDEVENAWPTMADAERRWFDRVSTERDRMRPALGATVDAAARDAYLKTFVADLAARTGAAKPKAWAAVVRRAAERRAKPFSPEPAPAGDTGAIDAFEELVVFLVSVARNSELTPTEGQRAAVRPSIRETMDASGPAVRRIYARMGRFWGFVRARWDGSDEVARLRLRWSVEKFFRKIAKLPVPQGAVILDLPGYATLAAEVAAALNAPDAYTSAFANPGDLVGAVAEGLGLDPKDLEAAFTYDRLFLR